MIDVEQILTEVEKQVVKQLLTTDLLTLSPVELEQLFAAVDVLGYDRLFKAIEEDHVNKVNELIELAEKKGVLFDAGKLEDFERLVDLNTFHARKASEEHLARVLTRTIYGSILGEDTKEIIERIPEDIPLSRNQLVAEVNQNMSRFEAVTTASVFDDPYQRFRLADTPLDDHTRCECRAVILNQPKKGWTKKQIDQGAATEVVKEHCPKVKPESQEYTWLDRGGYNCRHPWEAV